MAGIRNNRSIFLRGAKEFGSLRHLFVSAAVFFFAAAGSSCDSVEPSEGDLLVVEGFLNAGAPLPAIRISRVQGIDQYATETQETVRDATFRIYINDRAIPYGPSDEEAGTYIPLNDIFEIVPPKAHFRAEIEWRSHRATSEDFVPPPIEIDSVWIHIPEEPVAAILVDTLRFDNPQVGARKGFIYPIDVTILWTADQTETENDSTYWIETRLIPQSDFSSTVLDVFLLTEEVQPEIALIADHPFLRSWTGVYAIPVADSLSPPPAHDVTVQLIRSTKAYADFASSRYTPERREPVSNINGAIGILAGIALDSISFEVKNGLATARK